MVDCATKKNKRWGNNLVVIDNFSKCGWEIPIIIKSSQAKNCIQLKFFNSLKGLPSLIEIVEGKKFEYCFYRFCPELGF